MDSSVSPKLIIDNLHSPKKDTLAIGGIKQCKIEKKIFYFYFMVCNSKECHVAIRERKRERERDRAKGEKKKLNENASCDLT